MAGSSEDVAGESGNDPDATTDRVENGTAEVSGSGGRGPWPWWGMVLLSVLLVAAIVVVVAVLSMIPGESSDDSDASPSPRPEEDPPECVDSPEESTEISGPVEEPENAGLEVVETGFYGVADPDSGGALMGGYGVVLENPGDLVAYDVQVQIEFYQDGELLEGDGDSGSTFEHEISAVLPGQPFGFGGMTANFHDAQVDSEVQMDVEVAVAEWWPESPNVYSFGNIDVGDVEFRSEDAGPFLAVLELSVESSTYCKEVYAPEASAVYRNDDGDIVGGASGTDPVPPHPEIVPGEQDNLTLTVDADFYSFAVEKEVIEVIAQDQADVYIYSKHLLENED